MFLLLLALKTYSIDTVPLQMKMPQPCFMNVPCLCRIGYILKFNEFVWLSKCISRPGNTATYRLTRSRWRVWSSETVRLNVPLWLGLFILQIHLHSNTVDVARFTTRGFLILPTKPLKCILHLSSIESVLLLYTVSCECQQHSTGCSESWDLKGMFDLCDELSVLWAGHWQR